MPSLTDVQQPTTAGADADPATQMVLLLEKKQRNLGKRKVGNGEIVRKEKFDSFQGEIGSISKTRKRRQRIK